MAKVHIMMATYNGEKYIKEQINSILNQTYTDWKLYVSDDCSTDATYKILCEYVEQYPKKIEIINHNKKMGGAKENFSFLYEHVPEADYYMFADQDDVWIESKIEKMICFFEEKVAEEIPVLIYCDLYITNHSLEIISDSFMKHQKYEREKQNTYSVLSKNYIPGCVMMFNDNLKKVVKRIPLDCFMHDWWLTLGAMFFGKVYFYNESLNYYRQHENNTIGASMNQSLIGGIVNILKGMFRSPIKRAKDIIDSNSKSLLQVNKQTSLFLEKYNDVLKENDKKCFEKFHVVINGKNRIKSVFIFLKYFRYPNLFKNLYCIYILLFLTKRIRICGE